MPRNKEKFREQRVNNTEPISNLCIIYVQCIIVFAVNCIVINLYVNVDNFYFLFRNLFSRKAKESEDDAEQGWKLFGRIPPKQTSDKDPQQITQEFQHKLRTVAQPKNSKKSDIEVMSTTALILENRPQ